MPLAKYRKKRNFKITSEPYGGARGDGARHKTARYVIHKHAATRLHYDLRLEVDGVYKSWAVPKGPSLDPSQKRLAVEVEDHPLEYGKFEGIIPPKQYGAGEVIIWDRGKFKAEDPLRALKKGRLHFELDGEKLHGSWTLIRLQPQGNAVHWLLKKSDDEFADTDLDITQESPQSVKSGKTIEDLQGKSSPKKSKNTKHTSTPPRKSSKSARVATVTLTHPEKELFPEVHLTKQDLADYYRVVAPLMLPYLAERPLSLFRCPQGRGQCFFQKHMDAGKTSNLPTVMVKEESGKRKKYCYVTDREHLVELAQLNVLEIHPWNSTISALEHPDQFVLDLDPGEGVKPKDLIAAAFLVRDILLDVNLTSFPRVTGGKGIHIVAPITPKNSWDEVKEFCRSVAFALAQHDPKRFVAVSTKAKRGGKIYVDYLRNSRGATAIANYSTRAREGAPVAVPLRWDEIAKQSKIPKFSTKDVLKRVKSLKRDPWESWQKLRQALPKTR